MELITRIIISPGIGRRFAFLFSFSFLGLKSFH